MSLCGGRVSFRVVVIGEEASERVDGFEQQAREHVRAAISDVYGTVLDISFTIEDFAEHGAKIWVRVRVRVRVRARGTASGPFFGPPSNKPIDITMFDLARVANRQIIDHCGVPDRFALLAQTGMLDRLAP